MPKKVVVAAFRKRRILPHKPECARGRVMYKLGSKTKVSDVRTKCLFLVTLKTDARKGLFGHRCVQPERPF